MNRQRSDSEDREPKFAPVAMDEKGELHTCCEACGGSNIEYDGHDIDKCRDCGHSPMSELPNRHLARGQRGNSLPLTRGCTCDVRPPRREHAIGRSFSYAIYLSLIEDDTQFDPACPFHGDEGTMVARVKVGRPA